MGWTGRAYYGTTRKERLEKMLEVYNWEDDTKKVETIDAVLVGTTAFAAVKMTIKATGETSVSACVVLSRMNGKNELVTKEMSESMGPGGWCPRRILDKLTETKSETANEWRKRQRDHLNNKMPDHNRIPRTFSRLIGNILIKTNANEQPGAQATVYKTAWGYSMIVDGNENRYNCPVSFLRNNKVFKINQIFA